MTFKKLMKPMHQLQHIRFLKTNNITLLSHYIVLFVSLLTNCFLN